MAYFLVVEVPDAGSAMTALSRSLAGVVMETVAAVPAPGEAAIKAVCELRGGSAPDRAMMAEGLRGADPQARLLRAPPGCLRLALRFPVAGIAPVWKAIARFAAARGLGNAWATLEEGVTFVRILTPTKDLEGLADELRGALKDEGFDADIATEGALTVDVVERLTGMNEDLGAFSRGAPEGF